MSETLAGRVWIFGDNINTDLMLPGHVRHASEDVQARHVFAANRFILALLVETSLAETRLVQEHARCGMKR